MWTGPRSDLAQYQDEPFAVVRQERAPDALEGDDTGEAFKDLRQHVVKEDTTVDGLHEVEQLVQLGLATRHVG